ncbi:hypothetical protein BVY04_00240 [bacterium M21]|nr:hypothetical protein BVY04_00240 [bacterium M21]
MIPKIRGEHISVPIDDLVREAENLVRNGTREVILIAQDLTYYGVDLYGERRLNELIQRLADVAGLEWLRLHYTHPTGFPLDILATLRERDNICNYLDIPFQHISSRMLKIMNRGITREKTEELIRKIREEVPGVALRTTLLSGHPGETEEDHAELMEFLREFRIDRVGVFMYSAEEDTHSFTLGDDVPKEVKQRRFDELMQLQQTISLELNQARIGQTYKAIIDKRTKSSFVGRTQFDSPDVDNEVIIRNRDLRVGKFYDVEVTDAGEYDLIGRVAR